MIVHECIKCRSKYEDDDVDAYLCPPCHKAKMEIAAKVDAEYAMRPRLEPISELKLHEQNGKTTVIEGRQVTFAKA